MTENFPTMATVGDEVRSVLADARVPGGQLYSNEILTRPIQAAVRKACSLLRSIGGFQTTRVGFCKLPAHQTVLMKRSTGLGDLIVPISVQRRWNVTFLTVTGAVKSGANLEVTLDGAHGLTDYGYVSLTDIAGFPLADGMYNAQVVSSTVLRVLGCDVNGEFRVEAGKKNQAGIGTETFGDMSFNTEVGGLMNSSSLLVTGIDYKAKWSFEGGQFNFEPQDSDMQLRIRYYSSGNVPESLDDTVEIPASIDFLAHYAAMQATATRMPTISDMMRKRCFGIGVETRAEDGLARDMLHAVVKAQQNKRTEDKSRPPYGALTAPWVGYVR